jgi:hypothetical protein
MAKHPVAKALVSVGDTICRQISAGANQDEASAPLSSRQTLHQHCRRMPFSAQARLEQRYLHLVDVL